MEFRENRIKPINGVSVQFSTIVLPEWPNEDSRLDESSDVQKAIISVTFEFLQPLRVRTYWHGYLQWGKHTRITPVKTHFKWLEEFCRWVDG